MYHESSDTGHRHTFLGLLSYSFVNVYSENYENDILMLVCLSKLNPIYIHYVR